MAKFPKTLLVTEEDESGGDTYLTAWGPDASDLGRDTEDGQEVAVYQLVDMRHFKKTLELTPTNGRKNPKNGRRKPKNGRRKRK